MIFLIHHNLLFYSSSQQQKKPLDFSRSFYIDYIFRYKKKENWYNSPFTLFIILLYHEKINQNRIIFFSTKNQESIHFLSCAGSFYENKILYMKNIYFQKSHIYSETIKIRIFSIWERPDANVYLLIFFLWIILARG